MSNGDVEEAPPEQILHARGRLTNSIYYPENLPGDDHQAAFSRFEMRLQPNPFGLAVGLFLAQRHRRDNKWMNCEWEPNRESRSAVGQYTGSGLAGIRIDENLKSVFLSQTARSVMTCNESVVSSSRGVLRLG